MASDACSSTRASGAPTQKWMPAPKPRCGLSARATSKRSGSANTAGSRLAAPSSAAILVPAGDRDVADHRVGDGRAFEQLQRRVVADQLLDRGGHEAPGRRAARPARSGWLSSAVTPLPTTFTVASCPALSSSVQVVTSSSSVSRAPSESVSAISDETRSSPGRPRRCGHQPAQVVDELGRGALGVGALLRRHRVLVHLHDGVRPRPQQRPVRLRDAEQLGDHLHRQRLGVERDQVDRRAVGAGVGDVVGQPLRPARRCAGAAVRRARARTPPATSRRSRVCVGGSFSSSELTWISSNAGIGSSGQRGAQRRPSVRARSTAFAAACVNVSHMPVRSCHCTGARARARPRSAGTGRRRPRARSGRDRGPRSTPLMHPGPCATAARRPRAFAVAARPGPAPAA